MTPGLQKEKWTSGIVRTQTTNNHDVNGKNRSAITKTNPISTHSTHAKYTKTKSACSGKYSLFVLHIHIFGP